MVLSKLVRVLVVPLLILFVPTYVFIHVQLISFVFFLFFLFSYLVSKKNLSQKVSINPKIKRGIGFMQVRIDCKYPICAVYKRQFVVCAIT